MATPRTQTPDKKPISFSLLENGNLIGRVQNLAVRPEEMSIQEPSRLTPLQTLGGAFVDDFGPGLATVQINGTTGWRGGIDRDALDLLKDLRETVFERWHRLRSEGRARGTDPDQVELIFSDELNERTLVVVPLQFQLRRSRSRPLLAQYSIQMKVLGDASRLRNATYSGHLQQIDLVTHPEESAEAVREALGDAARRQGFLGDKVSGLAGAAGQDLADLAALSTGLLNKITTETEGALTLIDSATAPLIDSAILLQQAARNIGLALATPLAISQAASLALNELNSAFLDGYCTLVNHLDDVRYYFDFSDFYGASSCSSTIGGRPISPIREKNPFGLVYESQTASVTHSPAALAAMQAAAQADPLDLAKYSQDDLRALARTIDEGFRILPGESRS